MARELELQTYRWELRALLDAGHGGEYVLIQGDRVAGTYPSYRAAIEAGYGTFGLDAFFVKRVEEVEEVKVVARHVRPCPI